MYFKKLLKKKFKDETINIFVDMDGVITDYDFNNKLNFKDKRPLKSNIKTLEELSKDKNINLYILSICRKDSEIDEKNTWLDKNASYFKMNNRYIISKESYPNKSSKELKLLALKYLAKNGLDNLVLIDDDNGILKYINESNLDITLFQDSSIID